MQITIHPADILTNDELELMAVAARRLAKHRRLVKTAKPADREQHMDLVRHWSQTLNKLTERLS